MEFSLGKQIARCRKERGMTQENLANQLGVSNQAVSKWETDQSCPDIQLLPRLADLFGITMDALFGREPSAPTVAELPWEDDGALRAVVYVGHTLRMHKLLQQEKRIVEQVTFSYDGPALNVTSEFSVHCEKEIMGSVTAGDGVRCGVVYGSVTAGDGVICGNVGGNVRAGDSVRCGSIGGSVHAGDGVYPQK